MQEDQVFHYDAIKTATPVLNFTTVVENGLGKLIDNQIEFLIQR